MYYSEELKKNFRLVVLELENISMDFSTVAATLQPAATEGEVFNH